MPILDKIVLRQLAMPAGALLLSACTSIPASDTPESRFSSMTCPELSAEAAVTEKSRSAATEARSQSWHVIVPFIVAARYANASSALADAEGRKAKLSEQRTLKGCGQTPA